MSERLDHRSLYRLPWTLPDNAVVWLEPTLKCNLACEGCYRANVDKHKSLEEVAADLDVFGAQRTFDAVSIAGGDPLLHPQIVDIIRMIADRGWKSILNTNGVALTEELLWDLKRAGLTGFTFHVDSKQGRPGWKGKTEKDLNELRLEYAELVAKVGGLSCAFNSTVYEDTLHETVDLVNWAMEHIDIVHLMVFICFRASALGGDFEYTASGKSVDVKPVYGDIITDPDKDVTGHHVIEKILERIPDFSPSAYLNGTEKPDSLKWLLTTRVGTRDRIYGHVGPRMIELAQVLTHLRTGRYLAYIPPSFLKCGRLLLNLWPFDRGVRKILSRAIRDPRLLFRRLHIQSIMIIQPIDILPDGRQNMCDGCPDLTVWNGELVWSCRLEECFHFGEFVKTAPKNHNPKTEPN